MLDAIKPLLESGIINEETSVAINEAWESKLNSMDQVFEKLNSMEQKIEKYRPRTAQEKLELRSLDSGPFHQKLSDFFQDKQEDLTKSGKNEYVLTSDEVENIVPSDIKKYTKLKEGTKIEVDDLVHVYDNTYAKLSKGSRVCKESVSKFNTILRKK